MDNTIRVWNFRRGTQITIFDTHYPVIDFVMTETGERIAVKLAENNHLPILCLHNTPSKSKTAVTISIETASTSTTKTHARTVDSGLEISGKFRLVCGKKTDLFSLQFLSAILR